MQEFFLDIAGERRPARTKATFEAVNPATGAVWARIALADPDDAREAVAAAHQAWLGWRNWSGAARAELIQRLGDLVRRQQERLAVAETQGNGKPIAETRMQMAGLSRTFHYYAGLADKIEGSLIPVEDITAHVEARWEPIGVCVLILPWNSPLPLCAQKLAPALAAGNTVVIKPSEFTSTSVALLMDLVREAGFPPGVVNVVTGDGRTLGEALVAARQTALVAFTGGELAGTHVAELAGRNLKRVTLELGGKSPQLVFDDADIEAAAHGIVQGIFASTGQSCVAGSRLLVHRTVRERLIERVVQLAQTLRVGDPLDDQTQVGPIATQPQLDRVLKYFDVAAADGAQLVLGGNRLEGEGFYVAPTVFSGVSNDMRIAREEVFGPLLSVIDFESEEEALHLANDTLFGLAAGIWSQDVTRVHRLSQHLEAGIIWVNCYRMASPAMPFGGYKRSGIGREGGLAMMHDYLQQKAVWIHTRGSFRSPLVVEQ